jgi:predicted site-specific integrase-resolvase
MSLSTCQAARLIGVSRNTLLRWFREGRVADVARDRNGWRFFTTRDVERIRAYAHRLVPPRPRSGGRTRTERAG